MATINLRMNWMGGARSRVKAISNKKKQREFFEKQKRSAFLTPSSKCSITVPALSQDLISFHLSQRNLQKKSHESKPTVVIRQDLDNRASNDIALHVNLSKVNLDQTPVSRNNGLPKGWKLKKSSNDSCAEDACGGRENFNSSMIEEYKMSDSNTSETQNKLLQLPSLDEMFENHKIANTSQTMPKSLNGIWNRIPTYNNYISNHGTPRFPFETPDIHEAFKKYIYVDRTAQLQEEKPPLTDSDRDYFKLKHILKHSLNKDILQPKSKHGPGKKSKFLENMNSTLSRKKCEMASNNSKLSYSDLSKCTFASMPSKVNRNAEFQDTENDQPHEQKNYRQRMHELEEMIEEARQQNSKENIPLLDCEMSPLESTSSSSSGSSIPVFFQKKRKLINGPEDLSFTSIKKVKRSVTDTKSFGGGAEGIVNHQRKIKISDTTVLNSQYAEEIKKSNIIKTIIGSKLHVKELDPFNGREFTENSFQKSFLSFFPTPEVRKTQHSKSSKSKVDNKFNETISHKYGNSSNFRMKERNGLYTPDIRQMMMNSEKYRESSTNIIHLPSSDISSSDPNVFENLKTRKSPLSENIKSQNNESKEIYSANFQNDSKNEDSKTSNFCTTGQTVFKTPNNYDNSKQSSSKKKQTLELISSNKLGTVDVATSPFLNIKSNGEKLSSNLISYPQDNSDNITKAQICDYKNPVERVQDENRKNDRKELIDSDCNGKQEILQDHLPPTEELCSPNKSKCSLKTNELTANEEGNFERDLLLNESNSTCENFKNHMDISEEKAENVYLSVDDLPPTELSTPQYNSKSSLISFPLRNEEERTLDTVKCFEELPPTIPSSPNSKSMYTLQLEEDSRVGINVDGIVSSNDIRYCQSTIDNLKNNSSNNDKDEFLEDSLSETVCISPRINSTQNFRFSSRQEIVNKEESPTKPNSVDCASANPLKNSDLNNSPNHLQNSLIPLFPTPYFHHYNTIVALNYLENDSDANIDYKYHIDADEDPLSLTPMQINSLSSTQNDENNKYTEGLLRNCAAKLQQHCESLSNGYRNFPQNPSTNNLNKHTNESLSPQFKSGESPKTPILRLTKEKLNEDITFPRLDTFHPKLDTTPFLLNIATYMKQLSNSKQIITDSSQTNQAIDSSVLPEENSYPDLTECSNLTCNKSSTELITETRSKIETLVISPSPDSFSKNNNEIPLNVEINETVPQVNDIPIFKGESSPLVRENCIDDIFNSAAESTNKPSVLIKVPNFENIPIENFPPDIFNEVKENGSDCLIKHSFDKALQIVPEMADAWCQTSGICFRDFGMQTF